MLDAYDVLGVDIDAGSEDVKKAYRRLSLLHHPDKVHAVGGGSDPAETTEKFSAIKSAYEILQDADRRRVYDTLGVDLGDERPEAEVWSIGVTTLVSPMGGYAVKTIVAIVAQALVSLPFVRAAVLLGGAGAFGLYSRRIRVRGVDLRAPESAPLVINLGVACALSALHWVWPLLFDAACVFYLVSEVTGVEPLVRGARVFAAACCGCVVFAWLARGRWFWVAACEAALLAMSLLSSAIASRMLRAYLDGAQVQYADQVKSRRQFLRQERKRLSDEVLLLRKRLQKV